MIRKSILYGLILVIYFSIQIAGQNVQATLPQSLIKEFASRQSRYHHFIWHQVRENWNRFDNKTKSAFKKIGWEPPHPARNYDEKGKSSAIPDNLSGEDFLYMHREMIATANKILSKNKEPYGKIKGWTSFPAPGDEDWPVPANYTIPGNSGRTSTITSWKTDSFYNKSIKSLEKTLKDPKYLRNVTLGQFGARIEVTLHSYAHLRWSGECLYGYRDGYNGTIPEIDKKWDNPEYNWLVDIYSSAVSPVFWKIHGWVDDRIEDWRKANRLKSIKWKGTWTGGPMSGLSSVIKKMKNGNMNHGGNSEEVGSVLEEAFKILKESGVPEATFTDLATVSVTPEKPKKKTKVCKARSSRKSR